MSQITETEKEQAAKTLAIMSKYYLSGAITLTTYRKYIKMCSKIIMEKN